MLNLVVNQMMINLVDILKYQHQENNIIYAKLEIH